jgi:hypothetical protein
MGVVAPHRRVENAVNGDWSSDGELMFANSGACEFPIGRRLDGSCAVARVSPDGEHIARVKRIATGKGATMGSRIVTQSADGVERGLADVRSVYALAWSRDGREIWFTEAESDSGQDRALYAVTMEGERRLIARAPDVITIYDVAPDRRSALIATGAGWFGINAGTKGELGERALDHLGRTMLRGLSADGKWILMYETREEGRGTYLRSTDGAQTIPLGVEKGRGLSPDGAWALVQTDDAEPRLTRAPTGVGAIGPSRDVPLNPELTLMQEFVARWSRDGRRLFLPFRTKGEGIRVYMRRKTDPGSPSRPRCSRPSTRFTSSSRRTGRPSPCPTRITLSPCIPSMAARPYRCRARTEGQCTGAPTSASCFWPPVKFHSGSTEENWRRTISGIGRRWPHLI